MSRRSVLVALALLVGSAAALASAPLFIDDSYDWVEHTTSEAGAQGVDGAWVANLGFLLFGLAVVVIAAGIAYRWGQRAAAFHRVFAIAMIAVSAFSARSWDNAAPYDQTEDVIHSVAATVMGFAFAFGVLAVGLRRIEEGGRLRVLDMAAMAAAVVLPLTVTVFDSSAGILQRLMFALAFIWYGREAVGLGVSAPATEGAGVRETH